MTIDIEKLLMLAADFHNFCESDTAGENAAPGSGEMSVEELELIAAAGTMALPTREEKPVHHN